jgi:hypothetical protein
MNYGTFKNFTSTDLGFEPPNVTISAGSTVQWVVPVGYDTITSNSGNWSSPPLSSGESFNYTFNTTGVYGYQSEEHPWATGTITVLPDPSAFAVVRGPDNGIWYKDYYTATDTWSGWTWIGSTSDTPAAAVSSGSLYIVARSLDGSALQFGNVNESTGGFSGWTNLSSPASGVTPSAPALAANSNTLALVIQGLDNQVYYRVYDVANGVWSLWSASIGMTGMSPGATIMGNTLYVEVRDPNLSSLWYGSVNLATLVFSGWDPHGAVVQNMPTLAACDSLNETVLVMRGPGANIWYNERNATGWMSWQWVSSPGTADGIGATVIGQSLHIAIRSADGNLWTTSVDLVTHASTGWSSLAGASFSKPTLTG